MLSSLWARLAGKAREPGTASDDTAAKVAAEIAAIRRMKVRADEAAASRSPAQRPSRSKTQPATVLRSRITMPHYEDGETSDFASFTYTDAIGRVSDRTVRDWHSEGNCIKGTCLTRRARRTFRKDRIDNWQSW